MGVGPGFLVGAELAFRGCLPACSLYPLVRAGGPPYTNKRVFVVGAEPAFRRCLPGFQRFSRSRETEEKRESQLNIIEMRPERPCKDIRD